MAFCSSAKSALLIFIFSLKMCLILLYFFLQLVSLSSQLHDSTILEGLVFMVRRIISLLDVLLHGFIRL